MRKWFLPRLAQMLTLVLVAGACGGDAAPTTAPGTTQAPGVTVAPGDLVAGDPSLITQDPITITYWNGCEGASCDLEEELWNTYMETHPNVTVISQQVPMFDRFDRLLIGLPAGESEPTASGNYGPWHAIFIDQGLYAPAMPECMQYQTMENLINAYLPGTLDVATRDGIVYALPVQQNSYSLFINNALFEEAGLDPVADAPTTWDEMAALQDVLFKEEGGQIVQKSFEFRHTAGEDFIAVTLTGMIYQAGGRIFNDDGSPAFNSPEAVTALEAWVQNTVAPEISNNTPDSPYQDFADGLEAMSAGGPNALQFMYNLNPDLEGNVTVAHMPGFEGGVDTFAKYGFDIFVNANADPVEQCVAWNFLDFLLSDSNRWFDVIGMVQPKVGWADQPAAEDFVGLDIAIEDIEKAEFLPITPNWSAVEREFASLIQRAVFEGQDPKAALDQAVEQYLQAIGG